MHIAIIPDGNRRWARAHKLQPWEGHRKSKENLRGIMDSCRANPDVETLTVWGFSTENWKRDPEFVKKLMSMLEEHLQSERAYFLEHRIRVLHSGRKDRLSPPLGALVRDLAEETKDFEGLTLNLALDYGGKDEIIRAVRKADGGAEISEEDLRSHLDHPELPDIDCIIRTANEMRTSNFFLWQSTYAEWIFSEKLFPDFTAEDFSAALAEFEKRKRHFGA